jgi:hypothetical protein
MKKRNKQKLIDIAGSAVFVIIVIVAITFYGKWLIKRDAKMDNMSIEQMDEMNPNRPEGGWEHITIK